MQDIDSNWVYVVAVGGGTQRGWRISWIDMVEKRKRYFHSIGIKGFPKEPPNYIAFRYHGRLQSIHHIKNYKVITDLHDGFKEVPHERCKPHFLYELGAHPIKYPLARYSVLAVCGVCSTPSFSSKTIAQARDISKKREKLLKRHE